MRMIPHIHKPQRNRIEAVEVKRQERHREEQKKLNNAKFSRHGKKGRLW